MAVFSALAACRESRAGRAVCRLYQWGRSCALVLAALVIVGVAPFPNCVWAEKSPRCISFGECRCARSAATADCNGNTEHFVVRSFIGGPNASDVAQHCEAVCLRLRAEVFGMETPARWSPKCTVILHGSRPSYLAAVGSSGLQTVGTSTISLGAGRVTQRRIDLLAVEPAKGLAALPHELVHVLFVEEFPTQAPPKWAEEGLALVMDPADKQARHRRDLDTAMRTRTMLPISRLLADDNYPGPAYRAAFYGQSLSLVEYLLQQAPPSEFVRFVKLAVARGTERALADVYQRDLRELERDWRHLVTSSPLAGTP